MEHQGIMPDLITYGALISACEKFIQPKRALDVFAAMEHQVVVPNAIAHSALISTCEKGNQPE